MIEKYYIPDVKEDPEPDPPEDPKKGGDPSIEQ